MSTVTSIGSEARTYDSTTLRRNASGSTSTSTKSTNPTDEWIPSGAAPKSDKESSEAESVSTKDAEKADKAGWNGFDMDQFKADINAKLLEQIGTAKKSLMDAGVAMFGGTGKLYELPATDGTEYSDEVMGVGKDWGAEATSQRIVDFAMAFRGHAKGMSDEEFMGKIRDAIEQGFGSAKNDMGDLPGPTAKLFNDTYKATMDKLDKAFEALKNPTSASQDPMKAAIASSTAGSSTASVGSGLSILA